MACPGPVEAMTSTRTFCSRKRARAGPASFADRPPPAAGLTMAMNRSMSDDEEARAPIFGKNEFLKNQLSQGPDSRGAVQFRQAFRQNISLYLQRSGPRKILIEKHDPVNPLIV